MKQQLRFLMLTLLCAVCSMAWGQDVFYTLTPATGSNNGYANNCDIEINGITWNVTGNASLTPWRIGGKSLTGVDREVYSKTAMASEINKVELTVGAASSITVNSLKLTVAKDADFSTVLDEVSTTFQANSTISFNPSNNINKWDKNSYYKFTFTVTVSGNSNKFVEFSEAKFYKPSGDQPQPSGETYNLFDGNLVEGDYVITCYNSSSYKAMSSDIESGAFTGKDVSGSGNSDIITADNTIVWYIAPAETEGYWTLKNGNKYAASNGNNVEMANDASGENAQWSVSGSYIFTSKAGNTLHFNQNKFDCYGGTSTFSLYRKHVQVAKPEFSPSGGTFTGTQSVSISCETPGVSIYYTTDGTVPTSSSTLYTEPISIDETTTVKAIAIIADDESEVAEAAYTINVKAPVISPNGGEFVNSQLVTITADEGCTIYYTKDGSDPTTESTQYAEPFRLYGSVTVKAIAVKNGQSSDVVSAVFTSLPTQINLVDNNNPLIFNNLIGFASDDYATYNSIVLTEKHGSSYAGWKAENVKSAQDVGLQLKAGEGKITIPAIYVSARARVEVAVKKGKVKVREAYSSEVPNSSTPNNTIDGQTSQPSGSSPFYFTIECNGNEDAIISCIIIYAIGGGPSNNPGLNISDVNLKVGESKTLEVSTDSPGDIVFNTMSYDVAEIIENVDVTTGKKTYTVVGKAPGTANFMASLYSYDHDDGHYAGAMTWFDVIVEENTIKEKTYVKVTSTDDITDGNYLIVYEEGSVAFDGSLETLDAANNNKSVVLQNGTITTFDEIYFTINTTDKTIKSASGYYIGRTGDSNGLNTSDQTAYTNTISIDNDGNAVIVGSGGAYLRYNSATNDNRFRYYKSSTYTGQKAIQLYKEVKEETPLIALDPNTPNPVIVPYTGVTNERVYIIDNGVGDIGVVFYDADQTTPLPAAPSWFEYDGDEPIDAGSNVIFSIPENDGEERIVYLKVWGATEQNVPESERVYTDMITIIQEAAPKTFIFTIQEAATDGTDHYATISGLGSDYLQVPADVEVFTVTVDNQSLVTYKASSDDGIIKDGAYLVRGAAGEHTFTAVNPTSEQIAAIPNNENMLVSTGESGVAENDMAAAYPESGYKFYKLALNKKTQKVGFLWGAENGAAFTYTKGHQAYLPVLTSSTGSSVSAFYFDDTTDVTGISDVQAEAVTTNDVYTLSGVRVSGTALPKGIYIVNGNKVVIK